MPQFLVVMKTMMWNGGSRRGSPAVYQTKTVIQSCTSWSPSTSTTSAASTVSVRKRVKGGTFITRCRFGFPRETCETATLFSVEECMKTGTQENCTVLPRSPEEIRINNYNPLLLMLWKANIDLQYIGESSLAIARYVTGYMTKAERSNMQDIWQEVSSHASIL